MPSFVRDDQIMVEQNTPTSDQSPSRTPAKQAVMFLGIALTIVVIALGAGLWWFFGRGTPDRVDIDTAASGITTSSDDPSGDTDSNTDGSGVLDGTIDGTWTIDTSEGDFDFDSATGTFAGFRINEQLAGIGNTEAVGRTGDVAGSFTIDRTIVTDAEIVVDLSTITTNDSMRDRRVQEALSTGQYPDATFTLITPIDLGTNADSGATVEVTADGELTVHGVTQQVSVPLQAKLVNDTVVVVGSVEVSFADYGVQVPSSMKVLSVDDHGTVEFQLLLKR